ncbi:Vesicle-fusing ATPase [Platanthera guangdongensis]|uniref:Vesicle-fusing ATPase n=1 Tax=Platanthera guangdongensis TaxID=2320717 RepID=A0ABR2MSI8_9ASPA
MFCIERFKERALSLITYFLEGPAGCGKTAMAATFGIDSRFPCQNCKLILLHNTLEIF